MKIIAKVEIEINPPVLDQSEVRVETVAQLRILLPDELDSLSFIEGWQGIEKFQIVLAEGTIENYLCGAWYQRSLPPRNAPMPVIPVKKPRWRRKKPKPAPGAGEAPDQS